MKERLQDEEIFFQENRMEILKNHLELTFTEEEYHKKWIEYHQ
jgi:hypothetical protein